MTMIQIEATTVPEILRATRALSGLSTRELAPKLGVSHAAIARWERGEGEPSVSQFLLWAEATKQPAQQLLSGLNLDVVRPKGLEPLTFWLGDMAGLDAESGFSFTGDALDVEYALLCVVEGVAL